MSSIIQFLFALSVAVPITLGSPAMSTTAVSCTPNDYTYDQITTPLALNQIHGSTALGPVFGFNTSYHLSDALAAIGSKANLPDGSNPLVVVNVSTSFPWPTFAAFACESSYMGYAANTTGSNGLPLQYGHLVFMNETCAPTCAPSQFTCVALTTVGDNQFLTQQPCATSDDESQVAQFFRFDTVEEDGYYDFLMNVSYVGGPSSSPSSEVYNFAPGTETAPAIEVTSEDVNYQLQFRFIYLN